MATLQGTYVLQGFVADASAPLGYSVTNGARIAFP